MPNPLIVVLAVFAALVLLIWATSGIGKAALFVGLMVAASLVRNLCCGSAFPDGKL